MEFRISGRIAAVTGADPRLDFGTGELLLAGPSSATERTMRINGSAIGPV